MATLESLAQVVQTLSVEVNQLKLEKTNTDSLLQQANSNFTQMQSEVQLVTAELQKTNANLQKTNEDGNQLQQEVQVLSLKITQLGAVANTASGNGHDGKKRYDLTRPKDMEPEKFIGKDEDWLQWKEAIEDYADAVHPGLKNAMAVASDLKGRDKRSSATRRSPGKRVESQRRVVRPAEEKDYG